MKHLPGIVSTVIAPQDAARATETPQEAVVRTAVALVTAAKTWDERGGFAPIERAAKHKAMDALIAAVEGLGSDGGTPC